MEKYTLWILVALIAYVLFKDKIFGGGSVSGSFAAGTRTPYYGTGPAPSGNTYANTPASTGIPGPTPPTNGWDVLRTGVSEAGTYLGEHGFSLD